MRLILPRRAPNEIITAPAAKSQLIRRVRST